MRIALYYVAITSLPYASDSLHSQTLADSLTLQGERDFKQMRLYAAKAAILSYIIPTSGHAYVGHWLRGVPFAIGRVVGFYLAFHPDLIFREPTTMEEAMAQMFGIASVPILFSFWEAYDSATIATQFNNNLKKSLGMKYDLTMKVIPTTGVLELSLEVVF